MECPMCKSTEILHYSKSPIKRCLTCGAAFLEEDKVIVNKEEYLTLLKDSLKLQMLEVGGVDNWEGYGESLYPDNRYNDEKNYDQLCEDLEKKVKDIEECSELITEGKDV